MSLASCFQVSPEIIRVIFSPLSTIVPPPSDEESLNATPLALRAAPRAGASAPAMESPTHSTFVSVLAVVLFPSSLVPEPFSPHPTRATPRAATAATAPRAWRAGRWGARERDLRLLFMPPAQQPRSAPPAAVIVCSYSGQGALIKERSQRPQSSLRPPGAGVRRGEARASPPAREARGERRDIIRA
ncbi:hypothetical protein SMD44_07724 [Streptomyces alboflavus]|uniref:Uncharacterized protein n=1 Tax=Streptomyces alboflavus TaxID=67267 RepID=A0A1Z1WP70_9ACTN|nr:hypothetical protein SMD44_07724 [Streptomyces alboflavus]